jgi:hypothetical protein
MSRGLGKIQKGILECLEAGGECGDATEFDFFTLEERIWHHDYSYIGKSRYVSISRAIRSLVKLGLVEKRDMTDSEMCDFRGQEENQSIRMGFRAKIIKLVEH